MVQVVLSLDRAVRTVFNLSILKNIHTIRNIMVFICETESRRDSVALTELFS